MFFELRFHLLKEKILEFFFIFALYFKKFSYESAPDKLLFSLLFCLLFFSSANGICTLLNDCDLGILFCMLVYGSIWGFVW